MLTPEQREIRDAAALAVSTVDAERRDDLFVRILAGYAEALERDRPDLSREQVFSNTWNYGKAILGRLREIALTAGGHVGNG